MECPRPLVTTSRYPDVNSAGVGATKLSGPRKTWKDRSPGLVPLDSSAAHRDVNWLATQETTGSANRLSRRKNDACASLRSFMAIVPGETASARLNLVSLAFGLIRHTGFCFRPFLIVLLRVLRTRALGFPQLWQSQGQFPWEKFSSFRYSSESCIPVWLTLLVESKNTSFSQSSTFMVRANRPILARHLSPGQPSAVLGTGCSVFGLIVMLLRLVEIRLRDTEVAGHSGENYHPEWRVRIFRSGSLFGVLCRVRRWTDGADSQWNSDSTLPTCPIAIRSAGDSPHSVKTPSRSGCVR
jgi:hypothetical protein